VSSDKYEVAPGLWIGSEQGDLQRERQKLLASMLNGDKSVKSRIQEITDKLVELRTGKRRSK
jgi:hypothetical protein